MRFRIWAAAAATFVLALVPAQARQNQTRQGTAAQAEQWLAANRGDEVALRRFFTLMPKGADLHNHLSGAVYAERFLEWGARLGFCANRTSLDFLPPPCEAKDDVVPLQAINSDLANRLIDRMSTRNWSLSGRSGHDQFFSTFGHFGPLSGLPEALADMAQEALSNAAAQNVFHVELMQTFHHPYESVPPEGGAWTPESFAATRVKLLTPAFLDAVAAARRKLDDAERELSRRGKCTEADAKHACNVSLRWIQQINRTASPQSVFAQIVFAAELARIEPRLAGLNLVAPEDDRTALRDYRLHMEMVRFAKSVSPAMNVALHAGELTLGLVPPADLRWHVRDAVRVAGAMRIGHGVGIGYEEESEQTLADMRKRGVAVEINITSNDVILGVKGAAHPLRHYMKKGVPVTLSTDDEGVSRIDITREYMRAALEHGLGYRDLKQVSRNGLTYSFLPGASLWAEAERAKPAPACASQRLGAGKPGKACAAFLASSERARRQWALEAAFTAFESDLRWR